MKNFLALLALLLCSTLSYAQDPYFTQKTGNINHFNPALVGAQSDFGVQLNYRNQWPSLTNNPQSSSILTNYNFKSGLGVGLEIKTDIYSIFRTDDIKANVNYALDFGEVETRYGINLGAGQRSVDWGRLRFEDQIDPSSGFVNPTAEPYEYESNTYFTLDLGATAYYKGFMLGAGVQQVNEPNTSLFENSNFTLPRRFVGNLAYIKEFDDLALAGMATLQHQNKSSLLELQAYSQYDFIKLGIGYHQVFGQFSNPEFFSATLGVQFDKFSIGYSYDDTLLGSQSNVIARGSHQATAAWYIKGLNKEKGISRLMNVIM
jgi:type IX secretion system PorP/SprF family membrane protein